MKMLFVLNSKAIITINCSGMWWYVDFNLKKKNITWENRVGSVMKKRVEFGETLYINQNYVEMEQQDQIEGYVQRQDYTQDYTQNWTQAPFHLSVVNHRRGSTDDISDLSLRLS